MARLGFRTAETIPPSNARVERKTAIGITLHGELLCARVSTMFPEQARDSTCTRISTRFLPTAPFRCRSSSLSSIHGTMNTSTSMSMESRNIAPPLIGKTTTQHLTEFVPQPAGLTNSRTSA